MPAPDSLALARADAADRVLAHVPVEAFPQWDALRLACWAVEDEAERLLAENRRLKGKLEAHKLMEVA